MSSNRSFTSRSELMMQVRAMCSRLWFAAIVAACSGDALLADTAAPSDVVQTERGDRGDIHRVKHVIVVMMENHSFDNYFGVLPYAPGSPYHPAASSAGCGGKDHGCVDGLTCQRDAAGAL